MKNNELNYYNKIKNWDFSQINCETESLTNWDISKILNEKATKKSRILDLGTGGGEILIDEFPEVLEIVGTDFSPEMIKTANKNLKKANKKNSDGFIKLIKIEKSSQKTIILFNIVITKDVTGLKKLPNNVYNHNN